MGCSDSRECDYEEKEIKKAERILGFSKHSAESIDYVVRRYSKNSKISPIQLDRICEALSIDKSNKSISKLFKSLEDSDSSINSLALLVLALLLCNCNKEEKSNLIFQAFDEDSIQRVRQETVKSLLKNMAELSLRVYLLVTAEETMVEAYVNKLESVLDEAIDIVHSRFNVPGLNFVSESHFSEVMTEESKLLQPKGWRAFLSDVYKNRKAEPLNPL